MDTTMIERLSERHARRAAPARNPSTSSAVPMISAGTGPRNGTVSGDQRAPLRNSGSSPPAPNRPHGL